MMIHKMKHVIRTTYKRAAQCMVLIMALIVMYSVSLYSLYIPYTLSEGELTVKESYYKEATSESVQTYEWKEILIEKERFEISDSFINEVEEVAYEGFKSFEDTDNITYGKAGWLNDISTTNENGLQMVHDRYLVAIGTRFNVENGQYFDIVLENGTVIPCIKGDTKADCDTDATNTFTVHSKCATEFIVSPEALLGSVMQSGNLSTLCAEWDSPVKEIIVYENTYTEEMYEEDLEGKYDGH